MASAAVQHLQPLGHVQSLPQTLSSAATYQPHHVTTTLNYFKANEDGSPPAPSYVNKPETYNRPTQAQTVIVHDIRGEENKYGLDLTGFQVVEHESVEKDFLDHDQIKRVYYPETENLLKKS